jgi:hypothetical protein
VGTLPSCGRCAAHSRVITALQSATNRRPPDRRRDSKPAALRQMRSRLSRSLAVMTEPCAGQQWYAVRCVFSYPPMTGSPTKSASLFGEPRTRKQSDGLKQKPRHTWTDWSSSIFSWLSPFICSSRPMTPKEVFPLVRESERQAARIVASAQQVWTSDDTTDVLWLEGPQPERGAFPGSAWARSC